MTTRKATKATAKRTTRKAVTPKPKRAANDVPSLMAFAAPRLLAASLETLEEWPEILAAYHAGVTVANIRRWLIAKGYDVKTLPAGTSISRYMRENHSRG